MPKSDTQKILDAILGLDHRIGGLDHRIGDLDHRILGLDQRIGGLGSRIDRLESRQDETLEMLHAFAEGVEERFASIDQRFNKVDQRFDKMDERFDRFEKEQTRMRAVMVTKDDLDRKFFNVKGDIIAALQRGDRRVNTLVGTLKRKRTLTTKEASDVLSHPAFIPSRT